MTHFPNSIFSDYVYDGRSAPYTEASTLALLNEYGRLKAILEK